MAEKQEVWYSQEARHRQILLTWLRSGKLKQGIGHLHPTPDTYCCLGVACEVFDSTYWIEHGEKEAFSYRVPVGSENRSGMADSRIATMPQAVTEWYGFKSDTCQFPGLRDRKGELCDAAHLNDSGFTFEQIADLIEHFFGGTK